MKHWMETRQVLDELVRLRREGVRAAVATVVRVRGSAYRHEGAKLVVAEDGRSTGNVSGGCLEADVREVALAVIRSGVPELREYCGGADEVEAWDLGMGCEGRVELWIEPASSDRLAERRLVEAEAPYVAVTRVDGSAASAEAPRLVIGGGGEEGTLGDAALDALARAQAPAWLAAGRSGLREVGGVRLFTDVLGPPPRLVVVGGGDDARVLVRQATAVGLRVTVVDRRPALLAGERFPPGTRLLASGADGLLGRLSPDPETFAVVMTHHFADDLAYTRELLRGPLAYLGVLGPRARTERILGVLGAERPVDASRVYAPVGLDIGTDGAEQVALSVVAEILAVRSGRAATSLRERAHPIHVATG